MHKARRTTGVVAALVLVAALASNGCGFAGVALHNARWFFRRPQAAPRGDLPRSDDAALSVLWVGHATVLVQIEDRYVLTDPVFTETVGAFSRRLVSAGLAPESLPADLTVVVSHRHFDHLSKGSFELIGAHVAQVVVPEGAAADIPSGGYRVDELGWWRSWERDGLRVTAVPAIHDGARLLHDKRSHPRAFCGYVIEYRGHAVYFPGDTAYSEVLFAQVAARFPSLELALLPIGPVSPVSMMQPNHLDPTQSLRAWRQLGARYLVPVHFGTYLHSYDRPGELERRFDAELAALADVRGRAKRLLAGERWVIEAKGAPPLEE